MEIARIESFIFGTGSSKEYCEEYPCKGYVPKL